MANELELRVLANDRALKVRYRHNPQTGVTTITRRWPKVVDRNSEDVVSYLGTVKTVTDPQMDRQTYAGTWEVVSVFSRTDESEEGEQGYFQTLTLIAEDATGEVYQSRDCTGDVFRAFYFNVATIPALPDNTQGTTYRRGPTSFNDETGLYSTFIDTTVSEAHQVEWESRNTAFSNESSYIYQRSRTLIDAPSPNSGVYSVSARLNDDCTYDQTLQYRVGTNTGEAQFDSLRACTSNQDAIIYRNRTGPVDAPAASNGQVYSAQNTLTDEGLYNSRIELTSSIAKNVDFESRNTPFSNESTYIYRNTSTLIDAPTPDSGVYTVSARLNDDCTYDQTLQYRTGANAGEAQFDSLRSCATNRDAIIYRNRTAPVDAPAASNGQVYSAQNTLTDDGLYDARIELTSSVGKNVDFESRNTPFSQESTYLYRNTSTLIDAPTPTAGVYTVSARLNDDCTYDQTLQYRVGTNTGEADFESTNSATLNIDTAIYRNRTQPVDAPASSVGVIGRASNSLNNDGTYDGNVEVRTASEDSGSVTINNPLETVEVEAVRNTAVPAAPSGDLGRVVLRMNDDGTFDVNSTGITAVPQSTGSGLNSSLFTESTISYRNAASITTPTSSQGVTGRSTAGVNQYGKLDGRTTTRTANAGAETVTISNPLETSTITVQRNANSITAPTGDLGRVSARLNDDGTVDYTSTGSTATQASTLSGVNSSLFTESTTNYRNAASITTPTSSQGTIGRSSASVNQYGKVDGRATTRTANASSESVTVTNPLETSTTIVQRNATSVTAPSGDLNRVSHRLNDDGTVDYTSTESTATEVSALSGLNSSLFTESTTSYRNAASITTPAAAQGTIGRTSATVNQYGKLDGRETTRTSSIGEIAWQSGATPFSNTFTMVYRNRKGLVPAVAPGIGIYRSSGRLNDDATYDQTLTYTTPSATGGEQSFTSFSSGLVDSTNVVYKNRSTKVDAETWSQGTIYSATNRITEEGTYDATLTAQSSNPAEIGFDNISANGESSRTAIYRNQTALQTLPTVSGAVYSLSGSSLNADGTYNQTLTSRSVSHESHTITANFDTKYIKITTGRNAEASDITAAIAALSLTDTGASGTLTISPPDEYDRHSYTVTKTGPRTSFFGTFHTNTTFRQHRTNSSGISQYRTNSASLRTSIDKYYANVLANVSGCERISARAFGEGRYIATGIVPGSYSYGAWQDIP